MFKLYVLLISLFRAHSAVLYASPGHNVTLPCLFATSAKHLCWYKQVAGDPPQIISYVYHPLPNANTFYNHFKDDQRFSVHVGAGFYHLNISNVQDWDSAMYYCGHTSVTVTAFDSGIFLVIKESSRKYFIQQPASDSVKPGGSVTLDCTVHTGSSHKEHSVYWFRKESGDSHLGMMYIHTHNSSQCVKSPESPIHSCVYSLRQRSMNMSDAGTYYCAVASCGEILFGKGTRLEVEGKQDYVSPVLMLCGVATLLVSITLNVILIGILCKMSRRTYLHSGGLHSQSSVPDCTSNSPHEESEALPYIALDFKQRQSKSRRQRSKDEEPVYSEVRLSDQK